MLGCFYYKKTLNDTLVLTLNNRKGVKNVITDLFSVTYDVTDHIAGVNVFNWSNVYPDCPEGYLLFTSNICKIVQIITKLDLSGFVDQNNFRIGKIVECKDIPNTHLHDCVVDIGDKQLKIVCGAPNAKEGLKVVVATEGAVLPNGTQILPGELLGNKSAGMLCSAKELNLLAKKKYNEEGIIELSKNSKVGEPFVALFANA